MQTSQIRWAPDGHWDDSVTDFRDADLVLVFSDVGYFQTAACYHDLKEQFPRAHIVGCSSSGNVLGTRISDCDMVATAVRFEQARVRMAVAVATAGGNIRSLAGDLMEQLRSDDLRHVLVLSDGLLVNGSELAAGLNGYGISVTGGLAGDGSRFGKTWVMADAPAGPGYVAAIGLYGNITVKSGCYSGWQEFGTERRATGSHGNVVSEINGQPALALYQRYLGGLADNMPGSGLRFPLSVRADKSEQPVIRTLLAVDEGLQSLTFAGDVPQGHLCKLMKTNGDNLIEHAGMAADAAMLSPESASLSLCVVVSCLGRRLVLGQLTEEELEIVQKKLGKLTTIAGFYSYGELAPFKDVQQCRFHNQTMTLTTIYE